MKRNKLIFLKPKKGNNLGQWLIEQGISAGFPSPADDFKEVRISLDKELVKNKEATFYARVSGDSMVGAGLDDGDLLVIDRSLNPENGKIAVCLVDGEFTVIWRVYKGQCGIIRSDTDRENKMKIYKEGDQIKLKQGERHRLIGLDEYCLVAEIWQHTDKNKPSNEEDIVRVQDDFGR